MRSYIAVSIFALSASVLSAPTPQLGLSNVVGSVTGTAGSGNLLQGNGNHNGNGNGNGNEAGNHNGNGNEAATGNSALAGNDVDLSGLTGILKNGKRQLNIVGGLTRPVNGLVGDVTKTRVLGNARRQLNLPVVPDAVKIVDGVTGQLNTDGAVNGVNTDLGKRQLNLPLVGGLTKTVDGVTGSLNTNGAVDGVNTDVNSKRQLNVPIVPNVVDIVDGVTGGLNTNGAVKGVNTDFGKRQLNLPLVGGLTKTVDGITGSLNTNGAVNGVNTDVNSKRELEIVQDLVGEVTGPVDTLTNGLNIPNVGVKRQLNVPVVPELTHTVDGVTGGLNTNGAVNGVNTDVGSSEEDGSILGDLPVVGNTNLLGLNIKRGVPVVQDLPVAGGLVSITDNVPVVGGVTDTVHRVTGDLDPVTSTVFDAVKPVTEATKVLDVRSPQLLDLGKTVGGLTNTVGEVKHSSAGSDNTAKENGNNNGQNNGNNNHAGNGNGNGNTVAAGNSVLGNNGISL